ncbi:MAG TPA: hypothetical protein VN699_10130 [Pirellulales bacterium]|nr:hypothetical protein [Pirellulales bacterium]
MEPAFILLAERTYQLPIEEFDRRNDQLRRLWPYFVDQPDSYDVIHLRTGHGARPGTASKAIAAAMYYGSQDQRLVNLCRSSQCNAKSNCQTLPAGQPWPLKVTNHTLEGFQSDWSSEPKREVDARWIVGVAMGQLAFDAEGPNYPAIYQQVASKGILLRDDFAKIFALLVFDRKAELSQLAMKDQSINFSHREGAVRRVINKWR